MQNNLNKWRVVFWLILSKERRLTFYMLHGKLWDMPELSTDSYFVTSFISQK